MSPVVKTKAGAISDAQAMRWARSYFKAATGDRWERPPLLSQLVEIIDQIADDVCRLQRTVRNPLNPGAAELMLKLANEDILGERGWLDDYGHPVSNSCLAYYAEAFGWVARGARGAELDELVTERQARERDLQASIEEGERRMEVEKEERRRQNAPRLAMAREWIADFAAERDPADVVRRFKAFSTSDRAFVMGVMSADEVRSQLAPAEADKAERGPTSSPTGVRGGDGKVSTGAGKAQARGPKGGR